MRDLLQKFGPIPSSIDEENTTTTQHHNSTVNITKTRLTNFYNKYDPTGIERIDQILECFEENEYEVLWNKLVARYGPEPQVENDNEDGENTNNTNKAVDEQIEEEENPSTSNHHSSSVRRRFMKDAAVRDRLLRFYEEHNADKIPQIDEILRIFDGQESQLFAALEAKYCSPPSMHEAVAEEEQEKEESDAETDDEDYMKNKNHKECLIRFYEKYNVSKLDQVDLILSVFYNEEHQLWKKLIKKYGPEPVVDVVVKKEKKVDDEVMKEENTKTRVEEEEDSNLKMKNRLIRFFKKYNPSKLSNVDEILIAFDGDEDDLWEKLTTKYGPEPSYDLASTTDLPPAPTSARNTSPANANSSTVPPPSSSPPTRKSTATRSIKIAALKDRLIRFYEKYNPEKISRLDEIIHVYGSDEDELFTTLVEKYGPEPEEVN